MQINYKFPGAMHKISQSFWNFMFRYFPELAAKLFLRRMGFKVVLQWIKLADLLFGRRDKKKRVDIFLHRNSRGFKLVLDGVLSLWFEQNGDHFVYDGWEVGAYYNGDVTIFDDLIFGKNKDN